MDDIGAIWRRRSWLFVRGRGGCLLWRPCALGQMPFSGGWSSGAFEILGLAGVTMEVCGRPGSGQADHCPCYDGDQTECEERVRVKTTGP